MRKTGLLIDSVKGETALSILNELDLVDRRFKVGRTKNKLQIPLARRPTVLELELIETRIGKFSTAEDEFEPHPEKPESLEEALSLLPPEARISLPRPFEVIGHFPILIAKQLSNVTVDAIDLNPEATRLLEENLRLNHVKGMVRVWNMDAREAILEEDLTGSASRVIMNHPSQARAFVDTACQALRREGGILHYYTFAEGLEAQAYAVSELEDSLEAVDWNIEETLYIGKVRGTSPMAWQIAVDARVGPA